MSHEHQTHEHARIERISRQGRLNSTLRRKLNEQCVNHIFSSIPEPRRAGPLQINRPQTQLPSYREAYIAGQITFNQLVQEIRCGVYYEINFDDVYPFYRDRIREAINSSHGIVYQETQAAD